MEPLNVVAIVAMLNQLAFICFTSVSCNSGTMARLRMHKALVFPQAHAIAIFKSEKILLNNSTKWSVVANGRLCSARKPVTNFGGEMRRSSSEPIAMKCCVIGLWAQIYVFLRGALFVRISLSLMLNWNGLITD